ncbi:MAG: family 43 glycosylhydrolase [Mediterraneibacter sp.]
MKKRILSLLLAGGMILTSLTLPGPAASTAEAAAGDSLVAHYGFEGDFKDSINGSEGTTVNSNAPTLDTVDERGQVMKSGSGSGRIRTDNPLYGKDLSESGFTVSAWIDANKTDTWNGVWSFASGAGNSDGFYGLSTNGSVYFNDNPGAATYQDMKEFGGNITENGGWEYITVVMDTEQIHMYKDGALVYELTPSTQGVHAGEGTPYMLDFIEGAQYMWFGTASPHYWNSGDFYMDDLKVYSKALSADEVADEYLSDSIAAKEVIEKDAAALSVPESTMVDLQLPAMGNSGFTTIAWSSSNKDVIADDGTVTRPEDEAAVVTLTATITAGTESKDVTFTVSVPAADPSGDIEFYKDQLTLDAGFVGEDLTLPTASGAAAVTWTSSNESVIENDGTVHRPDNNTDVTLTATLMLDGTDNVTKEFKVTVIAKGGNVATYVSNDPGLNTDALRGQKGGMMIAAEDENGTYNVLHKEQPIMYTAQGAKAYVSPQIFRKADGSFGMIAADGGNNGRVFLYNSENLITYTGETAVTLDGISNISKLHILYNMTEGKYKLYVENNSGTVYLLTSEDLTEFSAAERTEYEFPAVENAPEYAAWASEIALTQAEYDKVTKKFTNPYNTSLNYNKVEEITVEPGTDIEAALDDAVGEVTAGYSNGEEKTYSIRWNSDDLAKADSTREGMEYTIRGTIGGSAYFTEAEEPLIEERADPSITYDEERNRYYFTASYPVNGKDGADGYDRLVIRVADTIEGLADAEEHVVWDESEVEGYGQFIWAPELHKIGDYWYFISTAAVGEGGYSFDIRPFMMRCNDADNITDPDSWGEPERVKPAEGDTSCLQVMSLDMTYFEAGGKCYVSWADKTQENLSKVFIATVDPEDPTQLTSKATVITTPEYSWECVNIAVNEGSAAFVKDGTVYLAFSAAATGAEYCVGLMTADADADLTDASNWTKVPYPVLTSGDFNDELCGPGHNSFTTDEYGNLVIVYHARPAEEHAGHSGDPLYDACRHAYVKPVLFDSEGAPVLNLSDEEFAMGGSEITVKVKVSGEYTQAEPVLEYNFDEDLTQGTAADSAGDNDADLTDGAAYVQDDSYGQVLYLDGDSRDGMGGHDSYLSFPEGFFDGRDNVTISMDVNEVSRTGNYFTFAIGQDRDKYLFLKIDPTNLKLAITTGSYSTEQVASKSGAYPNNSRTWMNIKIVLTPDKMSLYRDGELVAEENVTVSMSDLGKNLKAYLGRSFYEPDDLYFRGFFDNVKVYDFAMGSDEVARVYQQEEADRIAMLEDVQRVADTFEIPNMDNVKGNITLPSEKDGVSIAWTSSDDNIITSTEVDGKPAGVVTRGESDQKVTLTAVFSKDGQDSVTKTYEVTVKAKAQEVSEDDYVGYLFVHFIGNEAAASHEQTYFSISEDGLNWSELNGGNAVLTSDIGESGLRDHFIARAPEGDKYYMIATDLSIYHNAGNWAGAGGSGSHGIVVWESDDLVNWSEPWIAEIAPENAGCTWAPEFIYDESTGEYVVYWSATSIELDENGEIAQEYENHTIYYAKTRDFRTFTDAQIYHSGGKQEDGTPIKVIDSTMIENDGTYYRYTKNEMNGTIMVDKSDAILGTFTEIDSDTLSSDVPATVGAVEGPIIFKMNEKTEDGKDQWCLMVDRFARGQGYYPLITTDLDSGEFTMLSDDEFSMPTDVHKYRHGYVMPVTAAEYDALQRTYGEDSYVSTYKLEQTIVSAEAIDMNALTEASKADLQAAIETAKAALESAASTEEADAAAAALQAVIDSLKYEGGETVTLTGISVKPPTKTTYTAGDELSLDGLKVTAAYSDNSTDDVTDKATVDTSACNMDAAGTYTVTVTYTENGVTKTDTFDITVQDAGVEPGEAVLTGISVTPPATTTYTAGDELNLDGLEVMAMYSDNTSKDVTAEAEVDTSACDMDAAGTYTVTVTYTENGVTKTDTFDITVKAAAVEPGDVTLTGIAVTVPDSTTYTVGDKLDLTGLKVTASYSDSSSKDVTDSENLTVDTSECNMDAAGTYTVKVSYTENGITMSDTFQIKVNAKDEPAQPTDPDEEAPDPSDRPGNPENPGTSAPSANAGSTAVQTGDTTNVLPIAAVCVLAFGCGAAAVVLKRRKRY